MDTREVHEDMHGKLAYVHLIQKELTPSDVGKLNRLVIPKKFALKYFSYILETLEGVTLKQMLNDDVEIVFYDKAMKCWKFRYCYWRSSQSFVFTRGWNRFVKEKKLKEKDIITFYRCTTVHDDHAQSFFFIDVTTHGNGVNQSFMAEKRTTNVLLHNDWGFNLSLNVAQNEVNEKEARDYDDSLESINNHVNKEKGVRLFGVQIC
ncbi:unnamed protein product [Linum trigynum]|uniref:TF-B3 domain-containing protein n=1 Tax=Linum trigynum TaxID=586398 RepID=A0AAV2EK67_9ROSI